MTGSPSNRRGQGVPALDEDLQARIVAEVASGATVSRAADTVGVARRTVYNTRRRDPKFDQALAAAQTTGARVRRAAMECAVDRCGTEARYVKRGCRCPACTKAATAARQARETEVAGGGGELVPYPQEGRGPSWLPQAG